jgi:hypothetical protein
MQGQEKENSMNNGTWSTDLLGTNPHGLII